MSDAASVVARSLRPGDKIRLHETDYEVLQNDIVQRLALRPVGANINRTIEHIAGEVAVPLVESVSQTNGSDRIESSQNPAANDGHTAKLWLLLRPDRFLNGDSVWAIVRMPEDTVYGYLNPHDDHPDTIGRPRVSETEAETLRIAWNEVRNCEMDITLPYRIDGDQIGPSGTEVPSQAAPASTDAIGVAAERSSR